MASYFGVAKEAGLSHAEIDAVRSIVMSVAAGQVRAQFRMARHLAKRMDENPT